MSASTLDHQAPEQRAPQQETPEQGAPDAAPGTGSRRPRLHLALTAALAVAALGVGGTATGVLVTGAASPAAPTSTAPAAVAAPAAPAAPSPAAPAPAEPAPVSPEGGLPAGGATVVTDAGTPLPAPTVGGVRTLYDALARGDLAEARAAYAPAASGAPWSAVEQVLADPRDRAGLLTAMRTPPQARADVPYLYARDGYRLGLDDAGRLRFVRAP